MCIIGICENRKLTKGEFVSCWLSNSHGFGYAHWTGNEVIMQKGIMDKDKAWELYETVPLPHIVHFRIASAGGVCPELTHPFLCTPESELVLEHRGTGKYLFHNGTVSDWKSLLLNSIFQTKIIPYGSMSDSRAMAIAVSIIGEGILEMYPYHKWVCVNPTGFVKVGEWIEENGVFFSNGGFRSHTTTFTAPEGYRSYWGSDSSRLFSEDGDSEEDWSESKSAIQIANSGKKSCRLCIHYDGDMFCKLMGELSNDVPCIADYSPLPSMMTSKIRKNSRCSICVKKNKENNTCRQSGKILRNDDPCYFFLNENTKLAKEWLKKNNIETPDVETDVCGAKATIKNGQLVAVQSNFLDRLQKKYNH